MKFCKMLGLIEDYCSKRGWIIKKSLCFPDDMVYQATTFDNDVIDAKIVDCGVYERIVFKVNGKITSIYK